MELFEKNQINSKKVGDTIITPKFISPKYLIVLTNRIISCSILGD